MSDSNDNRKTTARQANQEQPSHYELARGYFREGLHKSAAKLGEISQTSTPQTWMSASAQVGQAAWAGRKDYVKSAYHAGMGFMEGVINQNPNSGQQLNNMKINQSITQGRYQQDKVNSANKERQNSAYVPKANQMNQQKKSQSASNKGIESMRSHAAKPQSFAQSNTAQSSHNKGIEAARQKTAAKPSETGTGKSANQGIKSYQSKANTQSTGSLKSSSSSTAKGSGSSSTAKSSGSSSGSQSSGSGQKR